MKFTTLSSVLVAATLTAARPLPAPVPTPPGIPGTSDARTQLSGLSVGTPGSGDGYSRDLFPHWEPVSGNCNTREYVLKRDGEDVQVNNACESTSGTWKSPYDGATWTQAGDLDIDHMVPLKNAWISGASAWTTPQRQAFANDISRPQLWAVTSGPNRSKGDNSPDAWKPPLKSFYCTYAKSWINVKSHYKLKVTDAEKTALGDMLDTC